MVVHFESATFSQWIIIMEAATVAGGSSVRPYFFTFAFIINLLYVNVLCSFNIHCFMHEYVNLKKQLKEGGKIGDIESAASRTGTLLFAKNAFKISRQKFVMSSADQPWWNKNFSLQWCRRCLSTTEPKHRSSSSWVAEVKMICQRKSSCRSVGHSMCRAIVLGCCSHHRKSPRDPEFIEYRGLNHVLEAMMDTQQSHDSAVALSNANATVRLLKRQLEDEQNRHRATEEALAAMYVSIAATSYDVPALLFNICVCTPGRCEPKHLRESWQGILSIHLPRTFELLFQNFACPVQIRNCTSRARPTFNCSPSLIEC